jgi:hypothetical protein
VCSVATATAVANTLGACRQIGGVALAERGEFLLVVRRRGAHNCARWHPNVQAGPASRRADRRDASVSIQKGRYPANRYNSVTNKQTHSNENMR